MNYQEQQNLNPQDTQPNTQNPSAQSSNAGNYTTQQTHVVINNVPAKPLRSKWAALALCFFLGIFGAHKFYEGKTGMGLLYLFTGGLFCVGVIIDFIILLFKPVHYEP